MKKNIKIFSLFLFFVCTAFILSSFSLKQSADIGNKLIIHRENDHDALWHIALISSIQRTGIPPENPVFSGHSLKNYHYFYDVILALVSKISRISIFWLYLKLAPFLLAFAFALTTYLLMKKVFNKTWDILFAVFLSIYGAGFSWAAPILFPKAGNGQSIFWLDQPIRYGINQQLLLSLILINILLILQFSKIKYKWLFSGVILGVLSSVKIYGFMVMFFSFVFAAIINFRDREFFSRVKMLSVAVIISAFIILNIQDKAGFPFIWAPGWFIRTMFEGEDRLNFATWEIHRQLFVQHDNIFRLIIHFGWGIIVFYLGNFGAKIIGIIALPYFFIKRKSLNMRQKYFFPLIFFAAITSLILPMFFIQKAVVWNSIQFMHYASISLVILFVWVVNKIVKKNFLKLMFFSFVILVSLPTNFLTLMKDLKDASYNTYDSAIINKTIKMCQTNKILILGSGLNSNSFVPAVCQRSVFFADKVQNDITFVDSSEREEIIREIEHKKTNSLKGSIYVNDL